MKAVISGATRGIGKAIATQLAKEQYELVLLARNEKSLARLQQELQTDTTNVSICPIDLSSNQLTVELETQKELFKGTTVLVNNLGIYSTQNAGQLDLNLLQKQLEVNLYSAIQLTQFLLPYLLKEDKANIINIGSVMAIQASSFAADYSISKHAFKAWNDGLREELRKQKVKVSAIHPGAVNTSSWDGIQADREQMIQPEDIAELTSSILKMSDNTLLEEIRISPRNFTP